MSCHNHARRGCGCHARSGCVTRACRVPAGLGARGATAPAREGAGAAAAGGRTARQPAQQRPAQRPPAQQPEQPVRALRGEYCRPAALRRPGGSTRSNLRAVRAPRRPRRAPARLPVGGGAIWPIVQPLRRRKRLAGSAVCRRGAVLGCCHGPSGLQKASAAGTTRPPSRGRSKPTCKQP